jgi:hypothetical protein
MVILRQIRQFWLSQAYSIKQPSNKMGKKAPIDFSHKKWYICYRVLGW